MNKVGLINYGMGNITSITNALEYCGIPYSLVNYYDERFLPDKNIIGYILPGVGAFGNAMDTINSSGLRSFLELEIIGSKKPLLGICLGMQLLFEKSEEDAHFDGLGFLSGKIVRFSNTEMSVPHVGWNNVNHNNSALFNGIIQSQDFYFDHSYLALTGTRDSTATTNYIDEFSSAVQVNNIYGVQFHPERSQIDGLKILTNFSKICGDIGA